MSNAQNEPGSTVCRGDYLIPDVLLACFDFLDLNELLRCMKTCRRWRATARDHPTFSRDVFLRDLAPSHYRRFIAQILHKERTNGSLRLKVQLGEYDTLPRKLREMLKRVWPRMERFSIECRDTASEVAILSVPSPRLVELAFRTNDSYSSPPVLTPDFLGGQAPELRSLSTHWVAFPSEPLPVLAGVEYLGAAAFFMESLQNVTAQCPRLQTFAILDPVVADAVSEHDVDSLKTLAKIEHIILHYRLRPQWAEYLIDALPLSDIGRISVIVVQDRPPIPASKLYDIIESVPGDMTVEIHTTPSSEASGPDYNFMMTSKDAQGRTFWRDIALGEYLPRFRIPESICLRIVRLNIYTPDWDKTCFWMWGLLRLDYLELVFLDKAVFEDLIRPERKYKRMPVPVSYLSRVRWILDTGDGVVHDVDFGVLHAFLRKGTMEPCIPLADQDMIFAGIRAFGKAKITRDGEETIERGFNILAPGQDSGKRSWRWRPSTPT